jgi:thiol-disulfide isomerase/thioredoxin
MNERRSVIAVAIVCFSLMLGSVLLKRDSAHALPAAWQEGASGYDAASKLAHERGAPLLVYFHTSWCGYCKRMERDLFPAVDKTLGKMLKVRIDPERSPEEQGLAARYGVHGYPSLFLERNGAPERVMPFRQSGGAWNMVTPDEFVAQLGTR